MIRTCILRLGAALPALAIALVISTSGASAQFTQRPSIGLQAIVFEAGTPQASEISPGTDEALSLGGGLRSTNNAARLQLEIIPDEGGLIRFPLSLEYYRFVGKTTFAASGPTDPRKVRWLFEHTAEMVSIGAGVTASFFSVPSLYVSVEGKYNYFVPNEIVNRKYYADNGEIQSTGSYQAYKDPASRIGAYLRLGSQVDFFDPFMLDFSLGYGVLNLFGKDASPEAQRNLLVADPRNEAEATSSYYGVGMSLVWRL